MTGDEADTDRADQSATTDPESLRTIAAYQFGAGAGEILFPDPAALTITRTNSGRPRQIKTDGGRVATYGTDGRFRLGLVGAKRLLAGFDRDAYQVVVGSESEPFVREGRNVFAKFVVSADDAIRPRDEVLVRHEDGDLLGVGRAELAGTDMLTFETGMAVKIRHGNPEQ